MPEESTFRKYACPKLKLSKPLLDKSVSDFGTKPSSTGRVKFKETHTITNILISTKLRKTLIAELSKTWVSQKRNFARNDFCEWLRKLLFFCENLIRNERKILRFVPRKLRKSFANGNPIANHRSPKKRHRGQNLQCHLANKDNLQSITVIKEIVVRIVFVFLHKNWLLP